MTIANTDNGTLKFGLGQLNSPTPKLATQLFRILSGLVGVWAIIQHFHLGLTPDLIAIINEWAVGAVPIAHILSKSFGWEFKDVADENKAQ